MLEQCCNHSKQCRDNIATLCCAKNRRCESSRVISPLRYEDGDGDENLRRRCFKKWYRGYSNSGLLFYCFFWRFRCRRRRRILRTSSNQNAGDDHENVTQKMNSCSFLVQFVKCWQFFLELNFKRLYRSSVRCLVFASSNKTWNWPFSRRNRAVFKKRDAFAELLFSGLANLNLLPFLPLSLTSPS